MRESTRPDAEKVIVTKALVELAAATRDTTIDAGVIRVYMPHLDRFDADEVVSACQALEAESDWFPKVKELLWACSKAKRRKQDAAAAARAALALPMPTPDPERVQELMARIRATCRVKRMPVTEARDEQP